MLFFPTCLRWFTLELELLRVAFRSFFFLPTLLLEDTRKGKRHNYPKNSQNKILTRKFWSLFFSWNIFFGSKSTMIIACFVVKLYLYKPSFVTLTGPGGRSNIYCGPSHHPTIPPLRNVPIFQGNLRGPPPQIMGFITPAISWGIPRGSHGGIPGPWDSLHANSRLPDWHAHRTSVQFGSSQLSEAIHLKPQDFHHQNPWVLGS